MTGAADPSATILAELDQYYREERIHPLHFACPNRPDCAEGCDDFTEARASLVGEHYGAPDAPRIAILSLDRGGGHAEPAERTFEAVRDRQCPARIENLPKKRHWYQTHELVAALIVPFHPDITAPGAAGRFAHVNAAKCSQNKRGKSVADARLFKNCRPYLGREFQILRPDVVVSQGKQAAKAVERSMESQLEQLNDSCFVIDLGGSRTFWLRLHHPGAWHGVYQDQKERWPEFSDLLRDWYERRNGEQNDV